MFRAAEPGFVGLGGPPPGCISEIDQMQVKFYNLRGYKFFLEPNYLQYLSLNIKSF